MTNQKEDIFNRNLIKKILISNEIEISNFIKNKYLYSFKNAAFVFLHETLDNYKLNQFEKIKTALTEQFDIEEINIFPDELNLIQTINSQLEVDLKLLIIKTSKIEYAKDIIKAILWSYQIIQKKSINSIFKDENVSVNKFSLIDYGVFISHKNNFVNDITLISFDHHYLHRIFYRFRFALSKIPSNYVLLCNYLKSLPIDCPNQIFRNNKLSASELSNKLKLDNFNLELNHVQEHDLIEFAKNSTLYNKYKERHENLEVFLLNNDKYAFASEIPVWVEYCELEEYYQIFKTDLPITGHIDIMRIEIDGKIGIWDFKPKAKKEKYAKYQVLLYAIMFSIRSGINLNQIQTGYFDENDLYYVYFKLIDI